MLSVYMPFSLACFLRDRVQSSATDPLSQAPVCQDSCGKSRDVVRDKVVQMSAHLADFGVMELHPVLEDLGLHFQLHPYPVPHPESVPS